MSYVIFKTDTTLDIRAITVLGLHAKPNSKSPIGFFGTGLKMAIATLVRHSIPVTIWIGTKCYQFSKKAGTFRDVEYQQIIMRRKNGLSALWAHEDLAYTTQLAKNWELWMAFRELEANTRDEGGTTYLGSNLQPDMMMVDKVDKTHIIIGPSIDFAAMYEMRNTIFLPDGLTMQGENPSIQIFRKESNYIYYRSMRVMELKKPSIFTYNILETQQLTEDRTLKDQWWVPYQIAQFLANSTDTALIHRLLNASSENYEHELPIDTVSSPSTEFVDTVRRRVSRPTNKVRTGYPSYTSLAESPRIATFLTKHTPATDSLYQRFRKWRDENPNHPDDVIELFNDIENALERIPGS